jgi:hypothetical protein
MARPVFTVDARLYQTMKPALDDNSILVRFGRCLRQ